VNKNHDFSSQQKRLLAKIVSSNTMEVKMSRIKTKKQKVQSQKKKNQNIEKLKNAEIEFQKSIKKLDYLTTHF